jgi:hypothetical protein
MQVSENRDWTWRERISLAPGAIHRQFIEVPEGATWADITIHRLDHEARRTLVLHALQLAEHRAFSEGDLKQYIDFEATDEQLRTIPVTGGGTVEVAFAANWSTLGDASFDVAVSFHGVTPPRASRPSMRRSSSPASTSPPISAPRPSPRRVGSPPSAERSGPAKPSFARSARRAIFSGTRSSSTR